MDALDNANLEQDLGTVTPVVGARLHLKFRMDKGQPPAIHILAEERDGKRHMVGVRLDYERLERLKEALQKGEELLKAGHIKREKEKMANQGLRDEIDRITSIE